uniref:Uncharacterized protein n=1 Tax=Arundo donax TaxID=35708 RepID=A0A0A9GYK0_ARUDO
MPNFVGPTLIITLSNIHCPCPKDSTTFSISANSVPESSPI